MFDRGKHKMLEPIFVKSLQIPILLITLVLSLSCPANSQSSSVDNFLLCLGYGFDPVLSQSIYIPTNPNFESVLQTRIKNLRFLNPETPKPVVIVAPTLIYHVQGTIICAKNTGLQIRIRSGGHDYEGLSYRSNVTFIILDMSNFQSIDIDMVDETAWVEAGVTLGQLYYNISSKSHVHGFPSGVCPTVGMGGHISGGGYGMMVRKYGLAVDNIVDVIVIDSMGNIHDRASMGEDLFWAIRGGGGSSFAVIVSWKIKLVRVPKLVTVFNVSFTLEEGATDVVLKWQYVAPNFNERLFIRLKLIPIIDRTGHENKTLMANFIGFYLGRRPSLVSIVNKRFPELNLTKQDCYEMRWVESTLFFSGFPIGTPIEVLLNRTIWTPLFFKNKSDFVKRVIPKEGIKKIFELIIETGSNINGIFDMEWNPFGGKMNEIAASETPFPHRKGNLFLVQYALHWLEHGNNVTNHNINELRRLYDRMAPYVSKNPRESFLNYRDLDIGSNLSNETKFNDAKIYGGKYFKGNFGRLTKVKAMVDPSDFFKNEQSIPPRF